MPKIFPIIKKIFAGGGDGVGLDMGAQTETDALILEQTQDLGAETFAEAFEATPILDVGQDSQEAELVEAVVTAEPDTGTATEAQDSLSLELGDSDLGTETESHVASAEADLVQYTSTATAVTADAPAWTSVTNAEDDFDGSTAAHGGVTGLDLSFDATLRCAGLTTHATPTGFTRIGASIKVRHSWDLAILAPIAGVKDVTHQITLRDSSNALLATLNTRRASSPGGTQATLLEEEFDITGSVSDAQLAAGVKVDFRAFVTGVLVFATDGTNWNVDAAHLVATYSRTGIS